MKPEIKKHGYETFSAPELKQPLVKWVENTFKEKPLLKEQKFNVASYSGIEKQNALDYFELCTVDPTAKFDVRLDETMNSLLVKKI